MYFLPTTFALELPGDVGEAILLDLLLVGVLGFFHVPVDERLRRIEDLVPLSFTTTRNWFGSLLKEMERLALSF